MLAQAAVILMATGDDVGCGMAPSRSRKHCNSYITAGWRKLALRKLFSVCQKVVLITP